MGGGRLVGDIFLYEYCCFYCFAIGGGALVVTGCGGGDIFLEARLQKTFLLVLIGGGNQFSPFPHIFPIAFSTHLTHHFPCISPKNMSFCFGDIHTRGALFLGCTY